LTFGKNQKALGMFIQNITMTCFWEGIITLLDLDEMNRVFSVVWRTKPKPKKFVKMLKKKNVLTTSAKNLSERELQLNYERVEAIDVTKIGGGYLCSAGDPVLYLIGELFGYDIKHMFCGTCVEYEFVHPKFLGLLVFGSNSRHFYAIRKDKK